MSKPLPVSTPEFWKERLQEAYRKGHLHYSVFLCPPPMWQMIFDEHEKILGREIEKGAKVLDAGCGYGRMSRLFDTGYTGVDISPDLLEVARKDFPDKTFIEADMGNLPFKDLEFDVAFCISIRAMIVSNLGEEDWQRIEKELKRVAKKVLILEYESDPSTYWML